MRINLVTPFAEKDAVKALGARWDATKKVWYVVNLEDLSPFMRWIPDLAAAQDGLGAAPVQAKLRSASTQRSQPAASVPALKIAHCGCDVLPWDHCEHSLAKPR